jgi:nucleotide-binding universal stress UspA family protein
MFHKILVPLDGSELAERVVNPAVRLAEAMDAELILLTVVSAEPRKEASDLVQKAVQTNQYEAGLYLKAVRSRLLPTAVTVVTAVLTGSPPVTIIDYARKHGVSLIVMSTHGRSGLTRWSFGRVADKVLRRAPCPTVVLRSRQAIVPEKIRRILVPLDGSALAEQVLLPTQAMALALKAEIVLLQVVDSAGLFWTEYGEAANLASAGAYLRTVQERLQTAGVPTHVEVKTGAVADAIVDYADDNGIDLIVLSSLGSSGFQIWVFGAVAERVMQAANCATLVVRQAE